jgi:hypothetical protein
MLTYSLKKSLSVALIVQVVLLMVFGAFEPEIISAVEDQIVITQQVISELSISSPADVTMSPSIPGQTGGSATGTATWTIITNNTTGFTATHVASSAVMSQVGGSDQFDAYTPTATTVPEYTFTVAAADAEWGYSAISYNDPTSINDYFKNNGSICNIFGGSNSFNQCWLDASTTAQTVMNRSASTSPSGVNLTIDYQAELGGSGFLSNGDYVATTTVTAVNN